MSEIVVSRGSVIEVDTRSLRAAARALRSLARELDELVARVARALDLSDAALPSTLAAGSELSLLHSAVRRSGADAEEVAERVGAAAALYEAVELYVERDAAAAAGDLARVGRIDGRLGRLAIEDPEAVFAGRRALDHAPSVSGDLYTQLFLGSQPAGPLVPWVLLPFAAGALDVFGRGRVPSDSRLVGASVPVHVRATSTAAVAPPETLAAAASRIPSGGAAQVRVERYAMPDGTREFAVYVAGTRGSDGENEPFDMRSNLELYTGQRSASYAAVETALRDAGARERDRVHAFGHSQGAMALERLALEGTYDTRTLVSFGSPVQADVGGGTLSVSVRHTDDPVAALQSSGHPAGVGAAGSFVVERSSDPAIGVHDLTLPAHHLAAYAETAAMVDASTDPRAGGMREVFDDLAKAESVRATEYAAERVSPDGAGAGGGRIVRPGGR